MPIKNQINREARGFLDLFRAKVGGQGPLSFSDMVQPTVDVAPFVAATTLRGFQVVGSGGPGTNADQVIPSDETWMIYSLLAWVTDTFTAAGEQAEVSIQLTGLTSPTGGVATVLLDRTQIRAGDPFVASVLYVAKAAYHPGTPLLLGPGTTIRARYGTGTGTSNIGISGLYARLMT